MGVVFELFWSENEYLFSLEVGLKICSETHMLVKNGYRKSHNFV